MGIFNRIFKMGQSEVHSALDKLEDPIKLTEQGIRDMKKDLESCLKALAEVKALEIRSRNEIITEKDKAVDYEKKAMFLFTYNNHLMRYTKPASNGRIPVLHYYHGNVILYVCYVLQ